MRANLPIPRGFSCEIQADRLLIRQRWGGAWRAACLILCALVCAGAAFGWIFLPDAETAVGQWLYGAGALGLAYCSLAFLLNRTDWKSPRIPCTS